MDDTAQCLNRWFNADWGAARSGHCQSKSALTRARRRSLDGSYQLRRCWFDSIFLLPGQLAQSRSPIDQLGRGFRRS